MTHEDEKLLATIRLQPCCWCHKGAPSEAAHVFTKNPRLDVVFNLVPLCGPFGCHHSHHGGFQPTPDDLFDIIAIREGMTADGIKTRLWLMQRAPKDTTVCEQCGGKGFRGLEKTVRSHCNLCEGAGILRNGLPWREDDAKHSPASTREGQVTRGPAHDHGEAREREDVDDDVHGSAERADDSADKSGWRVL